MLLLCCYFTLYFSLLQLDRKHLSALHVLPGYVRKQRSKRSSISTPAVVVAACCTSWLVSVLANYNPSLTHLFLTAGQISHSSVFCNFVACTVGDCMYEIFLNCIKQCWGGGGGHKLRGILQIFTVELIFKSTGKLSFKISICSYKYCCRMSRLFLWLLTHGPKSTACIFAGNTDAMSKHSQNMPFHKLLIILRKQRKQTYLHFKLSFQLLQSRSEAAHTREMLRIGVYFSFIKLRPCLSPTGGRCHYENPKVVALSFSGSHWRAPTQMPKAPPTYCLRGNIGSGV